MCCHFRRTLLEFLYVSKGTTNTRTAVMFTHILYLLFPVFLKRKGFVMGFLVFSFF